MDEGGVLELPMRMAVTLVIGGAVLGAIVYYVSSNCWNPESIQVSWNPEVLSEGSNDVEVTVNNEHGNPIKDAIVTISGLGDADSNKTGGNGKATLHISPQLGIYRNEGYLDMEVKVSGCYRDFFQHDAIKVVRS